MKFSWNVSLFWQMFRFLKTYQVIFNDTVENYHLISATWLKLRLHTAYLFVIVYSYLEYLLKTRYRYIPFGNSA